VADSVSHQIHVIDVRTNQVLYSFAQHFRLPTQITGLSLSPDENRLYVGNQGGESLPSLGTISIFNLTKNGVPEPINDIGKVNCPEGMSITPDGSRIYMASQCGGGVDPLFILDTDTETVRTQPGFAVGRSVALAPRQQKAYIARDRSYPLDAQVTVVDTVDNSVLTSLPLDVSFFAITPDSKYVLAAGYKFLYLIDADTDAVVTIVPFDTPPRALGLGPSEDGKTWMCYVWLPDEKRLFFSGLNALLDKKK
jgi:DNA-binding beta-propeller fold protein YncE